MQDIWADADGNIVTVNEFGDIDGSIVDSAGVALRTIWGTAADNVYVAGEAGSVFNSSVGVVWWEHTPGPLHMGSMRHPRRVCCLHVSVWWT